jgi:hypothetical protein
VEVLLIVALGQETTRGWFVVGVILSSIWTILQVLVVKDRIKPLPGMITAETKTGEILILLAYGAVVIFCATAIVVTT